MAKRKKSPPAAVTVPPLLGMGGLLLPAIIIAYLLLAGLYNAITPAATADQHNPDENAHVLYISTLATGHLPVFTDVAHGYENHQPPLYYLLCTPIYLLMHVHGGVVTTHALRWVSTILGVLLIVVSYRCIRTIFPDDRWLAVGTSAFIGLLPANVALNASVTNDALTNLLMVVGLWLLAKIVTNTKDRRHHAIWLGLVLGLGIWTKTSTLLLFPVVLLAYFLIARQNLMPTQAAAKMAGLALGLGFLIGAPWLIRNQVLYGDPVAQHIFLTAFTNTAQASIMIPYVFGGSLPAYLSAVAQWTFASFWGVFDSMRLFWGQNPLGRTPPPVAPLFLLYYVLAFFSTLSLVGLVRKSPTQSVGLTQPQLLLLNVFGVLTFLAGFAFLRFILTFFQAQGRYLYPALLPLTLFFMLGWRRLLPNPRAFPFFVGFVTIGLFALNIYTIFGLLVPRFSTP